VWNGMPAYEDESFGPVAAIIPTWSESEAIAVANDTPFGLGGAVITRDLARGERIAEFEIDSGTVFVNDNVRSDPRMPFGGIQGKAALGVNCPATASGRSTTSKP
jgi:succinate-semialdehyde dehydrogenase/glutarate-semialdehyde dehydrogenase